VLAHEGLCELRRRDAVSFLIRANDDARSAPPSRIRLPGLSTQAARERADDERRHRCPSPARPRHVQCSVRFAVSSVNTRNAQTMCLIGPLMCVL
jgi:hypothetical protein